MSWWKPWTWTAPLPTPSLSEDSPPPIPTDRVDGYQPHPLRHPSEDPDLLAAMDQERSRMEGHRDAAFARLDAVRADGGPGRAVRLDAAEKDAAGWLATNFDAYSNTLTGIGDWEQDKTFAGKRGGPDFILKLLGGIESEYRWRGSHIGKRIVETMPGEMMREGYTTTIQLTEEEGEEGRGDQRMDGAACARLWRDHAQAWRLANRPRMAKCCDALALAWELRRDADEPADLPVPPISIPDSDESADLIEALDGQDETLGVQRSFTKALQYQQAFGGGGILIGADDGREPWEPLDEANIRSIRHLTPLFGGWDGECIAWRYYSDKTGARYGEPEIYMVRNLGVPMMGLTVPGERTSPLVSSSPFISYVHESRILAFGVQQATTPRARVQMRGWSDSVFTRVDRVLSNYDLTWGGIAVLMQEFSIPVQSIPNLMQTLASKGPDGTTGQALIAGLAKTQAMTQSITRMRVIDAAGKFTRESVAMSGVGEVLEQLKSDVACAAEMPASFLFGLRSGLNATGDADTRSFYDSVARRQKTEMLPQLKRWKRIQMLAKEGPTRGAEPARWSIVLPSLWQPTAKEQAEIAKITAETDAVYHGIAVASSAEIAATRFSGSEHNFGPITLDLTGREEMTRATTATAEQETAAGVPTGGETQRLELTPSDIGAIVKVNLALAHFGLPPLTLPSGAPDPDGELTIAEFKARNAAVIATAAATEEGAASATPTAQPPPPTVTAPPVQTQDAATRTIRLDAVLASRILRPADRVEMERGIRLVCSAKGIRLAA